MTEKRGGKKERFYGRYILGAVILLYIVLFLIKPESIQKALRVRAEVFLQIVPVLVLIIIFMGLLNYFGNPKTVSKYVGPGSGDQRLAFSYIHGNAESRPYLYLVPVIGGASGTGHAQWVGCRFSLQ